MRVGKCVAIATCVGVLVLLSSTYLGAAPALHDTDPQIASAVAWLKANRNAWGSWGDPEGSEFRDTTVVIEAFQCLFETGPEYTAGISFLAYSPAANHDFLSRQISALDRAGIDVSALASDLQAGQNSEWSSIPSAPEGGWGVTPGYASDTLDTALALEALIAVGLETDQDAPVSYLLAAQNTDGGWALSVGGGESNVYLTSKVLLTLAAYARVFSLSTPISDGAQWLAAQQNPDGGWGAGGSTVYETAIAYQALSEVGVDPSDPDAAESFLLGGQATDGSWSGSAYDTARAVLALADCARLVHLPLVLHDYGP